MHYFRSHLYMLKRSFYHLFFFFIISISSRVYAQTNRIEGVILPSGKIGRIICFDKQKVICQTKKGKEASDWLHLNFSHPFTIKTNDTLYFDQRYITNKTEKIIRTLIAIKGKGKKWHTYLINVYNPLTPSEIMSYRKLSAYLGHPYFIDDNTIVITKNFHLLAFRDYDHDGKKELFTAWRITVTEGGELLSYIYASWSCSFKMGKTVYFFNSNQIPFPLIPEPHPEPGCIYWNNTKFLLKDLLIKGKDNIIRYPFVVDGNHKKIIKLDKPKTKKIKKKPTPHP